MEAFERGEEIEISNNLGEIWLQEPYPKWNWVNCTYRIKPKPKKVVVIEKWLCKSNFEYSFSQVIQTDSIDNLCYHWDYTKVKLLDTYEVEI